MTKQELLKTHFGYDTFREGQEAVIDALLAGKDVLAVMPTGAGKSICYQVPALMMKGITLVISPLISLMKDQVRSLNQAGISAAYLNSSLTQGQYSQLCAMRKQDVTRSFMWHRRGLLQMRSWILRGVRRFL